MDGKLVDWYDEKAAARILGVHPRTLRRWRLAGKIGFCHLPGGRIRYTRAQLLAVVEAGAVATLHFAQAA